MRVAALVIICVLLAGCGGARSDRGATTAAREETHAATAPPSKVRVVELGRGHRELASADLVVVPRGTPAAQVGAAAARHPAAHFLLIGGSHRRAPAPNVTGVLFREDEAAYLAGIVAALVTTTEGSADARVAWVGGRRPAVAHAFARGVHGIDPHVVVAHGWSETIPALCKEAALDEVARGASVILTGIGACADGALAAAHDQNAVGLSLGDFERPEVAVERFAADARQGLYHGGEDVVFGIASGAVGVGTLDPRVPPDALAEARVVEQELAAGSRSPR